MQEIKAFNNSEFGEIRTLEVSGEVWFVAKDVTEVLGHSNTSKALKDHVDDEDKLNNDSLTSLGQRGGWLINESGLYSLVINSKLPNAKIFKRWVTSEVLPSIRKRGLYATEELLNNPDFLINALQELKQEREEKSLLQAQIDKNADKVKFAEAVNETDDAILVGAFAKILKGKGLEVGQNRLFEWFKREGYLDKRKGKHTNMPTQRAMELGLFLVKENVVVGKDLNQRISFTPMLTSKGQQYFIKKYLN